MLTSKRKPGCKLTVARSSTSDLTSRVVGEDDVHVRSIYVFHSFFDIFFWTQKEDSARVLVQV